MFFDDKKGSGGSIASAILTSNSDGTLTNKPAEDTGPREHELLTHELLDAVHRRDMQGTHDALHALFTHFQARQEAEHQE